MSKGRRTSLVAGVLAVVLLALNMTGSTQSLWSDSQSYSTGVSVVATHALVKTDNHGGLFIAADGYESENLTLANPTYPSTDSATVGAPYDPSTLGPACGPAGSQTVCNVFIYDRTAAWQAFIDAIRANPGAASYTLTNAIAVDYKVAGAHLALAFSYTMTNGAPAAILPGDGTTVSRLWQNSGLYLWVAPQEADCSAAPPAGSTYVPGQPLTGTAVASSNDLTSVQTTRHYLCMVQQYRPVLYSNTVTATNGTFTHTDTWQGTFYDDPALTAGEAASGLMTPAIIVAVTAVDN